MPGPSFVYWLFWLSITTVHIPFYRLSRAGYSIDWNFGKCATRALRPLNCGLVIGTIWIYYNANESIEISESIDLNAKIGTKRWNNYKSIRYSTGLVDWLIVWLIDWFPLGFIDWCHWIYCLIRLFEFNWFIRINASNDTYIKYPIPTGFI